ncbi:hypothetical protein HDV05_005092 [Chytridiales sp. JEL 0842]|nr:hypothetical protein HDV05_005092 [Chytridiales sp. JEL 0842]
MGGATTTALNAPIKFQVLTPARSNIISNPPRGETVRRNTMGNSIGKDHEPLDFNGDVDLRHFQLLRCVGKGAFSKVRIVEKRDTRKAYALKYINKHQMIKMKATQNILRERDILQNVQHPLIVNLRFAFQDDENIFMVLDLMLGGDLRFHLDERGGFTEEMVRVWAAEIVCSVGHLHEQGIAHRDLKPDNILLDTQGHAHLTDFNIAVSFLGRHHLSSHSGTLAYMAPEIFADKGYHHHVDWWSLGVLLFELYFGKRPFRGKDNDELRHSITNDPLVFPTHNPAFPKQPLITSPDFISFLTGLLTRDPNQRLGCGPRGAAEIFEHSWFGGVDWRSVEGKALRPGFVPDKDTHNFDASHDLEELLMEDNPLVYKPRKNKKPKNGGASNAVSTATPNAPSAVPQMTTTTTTPPVSTASKRPHFLSKLHTKPTSRLSNLSQNPTHLTPPPTPPPSQPRSHSSLHTPANQPPTPVQSFYASISHLTPKEKFQKELEYVETHFQDFNAGVYESYKGIVDPRTMQAEEPPGWVVELKGTSNNHNNINNNNNNNEVVVLKVPEPAVPMQLTQQKEQQRRVGRKVRVSKQSMPLVVPNPVQIQHYVAPSQTAR